MLLFHKTEEQGEEVLQEEIYVDGFRVFVVDDAPEEEDDKDE